MIKKQDRITAKVKSKYWMKTHKFGIRVLKTVEEAKSLDQASCDHQWWDAICQEMKNVRIVFDTYDGDIDDLVG